VASVLPNFIVALAVVAFANGLWMVVNGFMVPDTILNVFWNSWVPKIDYQNWTFRAMMFNEFHASTFSCGGTTCAYPPGPDGTSIPGTSVLAFYGYHSGALGDFAGYIIAIIAAYRLSPGWALTLRRYNIYRVTLRVTVPPLPPPTRVMRACETAPKGLRRQYRARNKRTSTLQSRRKGRGWGWAEERAEEATKREM
jgi:hypothetical protein